MKIVMSALVALLLGAAVTSTDALAQPRCWYNGYNHCYNGHEWRHTPIGTATMIVGTTTVIGAGIAVFLLRRLAPCLWVGQLTGEDNPLSPVYRLCIKSKSTANFDLPREVRLFDASSVAISYNMVNIAFGMMGLRHSHSQK